MDNILSVSRDINISALINETSAREVFKNWIDKWHPNYAVTLVFDSTNERLVTAVRKNNLLLKFLKRRFYGKHYINKLRKIRSSRVSPAMFSFFEKHKAGGYHIHAVMWEPPNPNKALDLEIEIKRQWFKLTKSKNVVVKPYKKNLGIGWVGYATKTFGEKLNYDDRFEIYDWNPID
ncbi:hypothetical protein SAMN06297229_2287 [Pseudidiomarina planktonica]|uniref:Uncharacterized protein n=1 Tax=Pseudidiomarina planktonica TaxID=1323738 RepID=A0A1Y6G2H2_9GAMM|nr:hypothetical protein [Pseudidiomarina planktonica]RUO63255.1 hypothetical protein CWI77_10405 [Pseudidiomarina planktonica]SMQ80531.1 hypothetical protein SAMN06297229_2287 [Pseudidiomarina planktonica]